MISLSLIQLFQKSPVETTGSNNACINFENSVQLLCIIPTHGLSNLKPMQKINYLLRKIAMIHQIRKNIFTVTENLGSNNSAVITSSGVVLFDTPLKPTDACRWRSFAESCGKVEYVIISDHHIDHTLTNTLFGGHMIGHELTRKKLSEHPPTRAFIENLLSRIDPEGIKFIDDHFKYRTPDITLSDCVCLYIGNTVIQLIHKKGHTENSVMAYLPEEKVLFTGDNVCECGLPCTDQTCFPEVFETLDFIIHDLDVETIVPGHGEICDKNGAVRFKSMLEEIYDSVVRAYKNGKSREETAGSLMFADYIHCDTERYLGYPADQIIGFRRRSYEHIYDVVSGCVNK